LPVDLTEIIGDYAVSLRDAPLSPESRRTYLSRVRMYLAWLGQHHPQRTQGDPITNHRSRDWAVRDYRLWLLRDGPDKRSVVYANSALTAIDDFYLRRWLGEVAIERDDLPETAPRALDEQARIRWLRAVEAHLSPRDRTLALIPYYAGARISEVVRLDVNDVHRSARKAQLRIWGKGDKPRTIHIHKQLRAELDQWLQERPNWPHAQTNPALFLNTKGGRLTTRAASGIIHTIAHNAALGDQPTAHVLRHTLATTLIRGHTDLIIVAELLGHARLETTRRYSRYLRKRQSKRPQPHHRRPLTSGNTSRCHPLPHGSRTRRHSPRSTGCRFYMYLGLTRVRHPTHTAHRLSCEGSRSPATLGRRAMGLAETADYPGR
jgi:integrase/recombinase XerC